MEAENARKRAQFISECTTRKLEEKKTDKVMARTRHSALQCLTFPSTKVDLLLSIQHCIKPGPENPQCSVFLIPLNVLASNSIH